MAARHGIGAAVNRSLVSRGTTIWACDILEDELSRMVAEGSTTYDMIIRPRIVNVIEKSW